MLNEKLSALHYSGGLFYLHIAETLSFPLCNYLQGKVIISRNRRKTGGGEVRGFLKISLRFWCKLVSTQHPRDGTSSETGFPTVPDGPGKLDARQVCSNPCCSAGSSSQSQSWTCAIHSRGILLF